MKITLTQLRKLIKEEVSLVKQGDTTRFLHGSESGHPMDDEGNMIKSRMSSMKKMASEICGLLNDDDQVPAWVQDLVATSHNDIQHVYDYLMGESAMDTNVHETKKSKNLVESYKRITQNEMDAWKSGNWGYVEEASHGMMPGRDDAFMHPSKPPGMDRPVCPSCDSMMSLKEKSKFEAQGGQGYPAVCEECAELQAHP
jgi:hypothetical protein